MWKHLERGSSPIDWCEVRLKVVEYSYHGSNLYKFQENYSFSPHIAEFINTTSNILFFIMPPFLMILHRDYTKHCGRGINVVWSLLIVVGASSAYFHATLSLLGQVGINISKAINIISKF